MMCVSYYRSICAWTKRFKGQLHFKCHFYVNLSWRKQYAGIFEAKQDGITYYFVDNEIFIFAGDKPLQ